MLGAWILFCAIVSHILVNCAVPSFVDFEVLALVFLLWAGFSIRDVGARVFAFMMPVGWRMLRVCCRQCAATPPNEEGSAEKIIRAAYFAGGLAALIEGINRAFTLEQVSWILVDLSRVLLAVLYGILLAELFVRPWFRFRLWLRRKKAARS